MSEQNKEFPVLPLRDVVIYPHMVIPLFVGRQKSIAALEHAMETGKQILLVAQKNAAENEPSLDDIYSIGTVSNILQLLKLPDGTIKVLVEGTKRATVEKFSSGKEFYLSEITFLENDNFSERENQSLSRTLMNQFDRYVKLNKKVPPEIIASLAGIDDVSRLIDTIAAHISIKLDQKQKILETVNTRERLQLLITLMDGEIELLEVEKSLRNRVKTQMEKSQREYYLNEQMKAIQTELGEGEETANEFDELAKSIDDSGMSKEALKKSNSELKKLKMMSPMSAEATVVRNYIDWIVSLPWKKRSKISKDLNKAEKILDNDHHGLEKVKERILEYLAVQQRVKKIKGPILCLVGPPGVGKTSLGKSIAKATNRKFVRMSLGGVRDEAEIRGHRRTYVGSLPGKIIQNMAKVGTKNPLILLDEIDKMAMDFRGDPASALLEVLDPEQNNSFNDHYLEVDFDLSEAMFVTTANTLDIPGPLKDRMEIIRLSGYTEIEKTNIAKNFLMPKAIQNAGLDNDEININDKSIVEIIRYYTREAGVRSLERELSAICRKVVRAIIQKPIDKAIKVTPRSIEQYLGVKKFRYGLAGDADRIGQVTGLAWTQTGGDLLTIEAAVVPGKGREISTGSLGDVMQESIKAAMTVLRSRSDSLGIKADFYGKKDFHFHVPEGATPKDGPSAGIGMCLAMASALTGIRVKRSVAMTGEITLRGEVLPIGGLKEKLLAAQRGGIKTVLIPDDNKRDLKEIPGAVKTGLEIVPVKWIDEVLPIALQSLPEPLESAQSDVDVSKKKPKESDDSDLLRRH
ncbi:MAG: endopeptidase La [Methylococcaceae bacterium TMED69]|nr:MAG: endopeptidase La [Methylococcaceae bacterium TMED69]